MSHCDSSPKNMCQNVHFQVDVQNVHLETKCSWVKLSQGKNVTVNVSTGSKCHGGQNVGGHNVKTPSDMVLFLGYGQGEIERQLNYSKLYLDNIVVLTVLQRKKKFSDDCKFETCLPKTLKIRHNSILSKKCSVFTEYANYCSNASPSKAPIKL